ncbi:uncharacterized protein BDZ83DRAFT_604266 [Colletotrichum acutatum]|uniref:Secreted protein n=1 Tax=Glomerella acutata TaxID=27357 RepID=A0AAD8XM44_GLOAC|nr:uncharacterized protein BDZ83DRAFT_604266 [Colletotrichum acutatum]KAK1729965.1 hypothetical protein BDZ83DRAFT_604266 [Colletotrichum acutatum]
MPGSGLLLGGLRSAYCWARGILVGVCARAVSCMHVRTRRKCRLAGKLVGGLGCVAEEAEEEGMRWNCWGRNVPDTMTGVRNGRSRRGDGGMYGDPSSWVGMTMIPPSHSLYGVPILA